MKRYLILFIIIFLKISAIAQKSEQIKIDWPPEYKWKVVNQENDNRHQLITIIPGDQSVNNAQIVGSIAAYFGVQYEKIDEIIDYYKKALDEGSVLTILEKQDSVKHKWVIFKIETPKTTKYPEPESDLYYVTQGDYALYANWVAIKKDSLSTEFIMKWTQIFKTCKIVIE